MKSIDLEEGQDLTSCETLIMIAGKAADLVCALLKRQQISKEEKAEIRIKTKQGLCPQNSSQYGR